MSQFHSLPREMQVRFSKIRALTIDVDGVLTDGQIIYDEVGRLYHSFNIHDGYGIKAVQKLGIDVAIISGRASQAVETRASELAIQDVYQGITDKTVALNDLCRRKNIVPGLVAHIGDDVPDICLFQLVGLAVCVPNGTEIARKSAHFITTKRGGNGAVREICDIIVEAKNR